MYAQSHAVLYTGRKNTTQKKAYTSASQTFSCCGPATLSAEAARPFVIKFQFLRRLTWEGA